MKASAFEFRFRYLIHVVIYVLAFAAPWNYWLHTDIIGTWQWLAARLGRAGVNFATATNTILLAAIAASVIGAALRLWGTAYLGAGVMQDRAMHGDRILASGPYRHLRNPLYLGTFFNTLALSTLMLPTAAAFAILAIGIFQIRLILAEESFLTAKLGEVYKAYCARVPRLLPSITPRVPDRGTKPNWGLGTLSEIFFLGTAISFAALGWRYNAQLIVQGVVISLGLSIVAKAFIPAPAKD